MNEHREHNSSAAVPDGLREAMVRDSGAIQEVMRRDKASLFADTAHAAYAETLLDLIGEGKPLVIVEADLMKSAGTAPVAERYPDRVIQAGVAEQNAVSLAAGLAEMDLIPFVDTFAVLLSRRAADQIWMAVAFSDHNVKLFGLYSGFTTGNNGPTHQSLEDVAILRSYHNMIILEPADCQELRQAVRVAADYRGPVYLRSVRGDLPALLDPSEPPFVIGKAAVLRPGNDATVVASGIMVQYALQAHEILIQHGICARVVDARTIKPLDEEVVLRCARETGAIVTVEDHGVIGGLGGSVAELLGEQCPTPMRRIGVRGPFGDAGTWEWLLEKYGMDVPHIVAAVQKVVSQKCQEE